MELDVEERVGELKNYQGWQTWNQQRNKEEGSEDELPLGFPVEPDVYTIVNNASGSEFS